MKLIIEKHILALGVEYSQVLISLNDQLVSPIHMPDWGPLLMHSTMKVWRSTETTLVPNLNLEQHAMLLKTSSSITLEKDIIYCILHWDVPLGWVSYFTSLNEGELLNFYWNPTVLLKAGPDKTYYA